MLHLNNTQRYALSIMEEQADRYDNELYEAAEKCNGLTGDYFDYWYKYSIIVNKTDLHQAALFARENRYNKP